MTSFITAVNPENTSLTHDTNRLRLISGTSNTKLAKEIAAYMGITNVPLVSKKFADGVHEKFPNKKLAYNCSPSFNWKKNLDAPTISKFQRERGAMGYSFQFVTLAGFHA